MTTAELAEYLRFPSRHAAHRWLTDNRVPYKKRGPKCVLVRREDVDARLEDR